MPEFNCTIEFDGDLTKCTAYIRVYADDEQDARGQLAAMGIASEYVHTDWPGTEVVTKSVEEVMLGAVEQEFLQIQNCLVDPEERRPGRTYERVQETLTEVRQLQTALQTKPIGVMAVGELDTYILPSSVPPGRYLLVPEDPDAPQKPVEPMTTASDNERIEGIEDAIRALVTEVRAEAFEEGREAENAKIKRIREILGDDQIGR